MISHGNDDDSLIGYDPLAWLQEVNNEDLQNLDESAVISSDNLTKLEIESPLNNSESIIQESENLVNNIITLEANQTIQNITVLHERLAFALESGEKIDIDASSVISIDTATLQLLLIMTRTALRLQREVVIDFPSERFIEAARLLGLSELLGVEQSASGFF
jgi:anti-anti-sigma regulatory factor